MGAEANLETVAACKRARKRLRAAVTSEDEEDDTSLGSIRLTFASGGSSPRFDDGLLRIFREFFNLSSFSRDHIIRISNQDMELLSFSVP